MSDVGSDAEIRAKRLRSRLLRKQGQEASQAPEHKWQAPEPKDCEVDDERFSALRASLQTQHRRSVDRTRRSLAKAREAFTQHTTDLGVATVRRTTFALDHAHGHAPISAALGVCGDTLSDLALDDRFCGLQSSSLRFVDTETTGLAGGAGTIPFLTGLSWFEADALVVLQVVVLDPSEERPALDLVARHISQRSTLVSFNGKSFDWPLLRTRFLLGRVACPAPDAHFDLLHVARRVFAHQDLPDRRLQTLEREVLGFVRHDDLPGAEIPDTYRRFLRERDPGLLEPILEHNLHDLVALPALLGHCAQLLARQETATLDAGQLWSFANLCSKRGQTARAFMLAERCAAQTRDLDLRVRARLLAAQLARRQNNDEVAGEQLFRAVEVRVRDTRLQAESCLAYAKFLEHRARRFSDALVYARRTAEAEGEQACQRRLERLARRVGRLGD